MRLVGISDTHLRHLRYDIDVPPGEILIHAGDAMIEGTELEARAFFQWFGSLPHEHKIFCAGNHDGIFEKYPELARSLVPAGVTYLQDSEVTIAGLRIYGSPWTPEFMNWAFNLPRGEALKRKWARIPAGLDVLVTHGPPWGILDQVLGEHAHLGCADLRDAVLRAKPRLHVFGHIHTGHGQLVHQGATRFANVAICDERYAPSFPATVIELEARKGP